MPHPNSAGGKASGSRMYFAPKGLQHTSPGQRPGTRYAETNSALKGRNNETAGRDRSFVTPFQGYCGTVVLDSRGVAPGWYIAAPSGRKKRIGHATPDHRENGHLMPFRIFPHALCRLCFAPFSWLFRLTARHANPRPTQIPLAERHRDQACISPRRGCNIPAQGNALGPDTPRPIQP